MGQGMLAGAGPGALAGQMRRPGTTDSGYAGGALASRAPVDARRRRRGQPPILLTHGSAGLPSFVFVGLLGMLTTLPDEALEDAFRRMDANADGELTFAELIAFLLREADVALTFKASQDSYLLEPPLADDPTSTAVIARPGGLLAFVPLPTMQGYAMAFADGALRVTDDELRPGLALDTAHIPSPSQACLPFDSVPDTIPGQRLRKARGGGDPGSPRHRRNASGRSPSGPGGGAASASGTFGPSRALVITFADAEAAKRREEAAAADRTARLRRTREDQQRRLEEAKARSLKRGSVMPRVLPPGEAAGAPAADASATAAAEAAGAANEARAGSLGGAAPPAGGGAAPSSGSGAMDIDEMTNAEIRQKARALQLELTGHGAVMGTSGAGKAQGGPEPAASFVASGAESARVILALVFDAEASRVVAVRADRVLLVFDLTPYKADSQTPLRELAARASADMAAADLRGVKEARLQALAKAAGASNSGPEGRGLSGLVDADGHVTGRAAIALATAAGLGSDAARRADGPAAAGPGSDLWLGSQERWEAARSRGVADVDGSDPLAFALRIQEARKAAVLAAMDESSAPARALGQTAGSTQAGPRRDRGIAPPSDATGMHGEGASGAGGETASSRAVSGAVAAALAARGQAGDTIVDASELGRATGVGMGRIANASVRGGASRAAGTACWSG